MATQHFKLENLSCPSCITHLEAMGDDVPGIHKVDASYRSSSMKVEYDEAKQSTQGIMAAVSELGYIAIPHQAPEPSERKQPRWKKFLSP